MATRRNRRRLLGQFDWCRRASKDQLPRMERMVRTVQTERNGTDGADGADGLSAYDIWLTAGNDWQRRRTSSQAYVGHDGADGSAAEQTAQTVLTA